MNTQKRLLNLLLVSMLVLVLSACHTKRSQEENSITASQHPTMQTAKDGFVGSGAGGGDSNNSNGNSDQNTTNPITKLNLTIDNSTLNKDTNTTLKVEATYKNKTTKDITSQAQWLITPKDTVKITDHTLTALKDTNVTMQAKVGNIFSNKVKLNVYWEVRGHRLPPEPDPKVNNSTLLGVDVNKNGVRDDVERWIYEKYKDKHPIHIDIAMQAGRAYKLVLETPEKAKEIRLQVNSPYFCASYYMNYAKYFNEPILVHKRIDVPMKSKYFNIEERKDVYWQYDKLLSGDSYTLPKITELKSLCDFNTSKYDKE